MASFMFVLNRGKKPTYDLQRDGRNVDVDVEISNEAVDDALRRARAGSGDTVGVQGPDGRFQRLQHSRGRWR